MRRLLAVLALIPALAAADPAAPAGGGELEVLVVLPSYGEAIFGEVEIGADVYPPDAAVARVEFYLDSRLLGVVESPPYALRIDAGQDNVEHHFRVVVHGAGGATAESSVWTPRIETDEEISVDLQQLYVTIERGAERVLDLDRGGFAVLDNGQRQQLVTFERGEVPFTAVLLVDASSSMKGRPLAIALEGAEAFVRGMRPLDQAKLLLFSDRLLHETPFTTFAAVLTVGLAGVEAGGGTALNDHLYLALKRLEARQGRRVVVILSDGVDVESVLPMAQVKWSASQLQPVIYWIRLEERGGNRSMWRGPEASDEEIELLRQTVEESGGQIAVIDRIEDVAGAFRWILDDLRDQYVLGYYPPEKKGKSAWHKVVVRVDGADLAVRTRGRYLEPTRWKR